MIVNLQRKVKIDSKAFREFIETLPSAVTEAADSTFSVAFVSDRRMIELNKFFRSKDSTTDVLSFPHEPDEFEILGSPPYEGGVAAVSADGVVLSYSEKPKSFLGDIVISVEQAQRQATENKLTLENEIKQLILHGVLHLCGYDHETDSGEMDERELELRNELKI